MFCYVLLCAIFVYWNIKVVRHIFRILISNLYFNLSINCFPSTTSSRRSKARAKLEAILAKVKLAEEEAALYKRKAIIRQQTDEEQINADLNVLHTVSFH
jgi:hypothetical protein